MKYQMNDNGDGDFIEPFSGTRVMARGEETNASALKRLDAVMGLLGYVWSPKGKEGA